jgi:arylsulfatase A
MTAYGPKYTSLWTATAYAFARRNQAWHCILLALGLCLVDIDCAEARTRSPNIVLIVADDAGYGDIGCFGAKDIATPHIDQLAAEGLIGTAFYVASPICTPSRAAFLTGAYPHRAGLERRSLTPDSLRGIKATKLNIAQMLGQQGYRTGAFGKWHLGHRAGSRPWDVGFHVFTGLFYGHNQLADDELSTSVELTNWPKDAPERTPLSLLNRRITAAAVEFIRRHHDERFFLYLPMFGPREPWIVPHEMIGTSARGPFGDSMQDVDWGVGLITKTLQECGLDEETIVIFFSDNGGNVEVGSSNAPFSGSKGTISEGAMRVPFVLRWSGVVPAGMHWSESLRAIDLVPTIAEVVGYPLNAERHSIDGTSVLDIWLGARDSSMETQPVFFHSAEGFLRGVRVGDFKLNSFEGKMFDLKSDPAETNDVSSSQPEIRENLAMLLDRQYEIMWSEYIEQWISNKLHNFYYARIRGREWIFAGVALAGALSAGWIVFVVFKRLRSTRLVRSSSAQK